MKMGLRDILVCLETTETGDGRLELALNLAQASKAYLTAVYALPEPRAGSPPAWASGNDSVSTVIVSPPGPLARL